MSQWSCCVFSCAKQINLTFNLSIIFCGEKMYCDKKTVPAKSSERLDFNRAFVFHAGPIIMVFIYRKVIEQTVS